MIIAFGAAITHRMSCGQLHDLVFLVHPSNLLESPFAK
jgi:hypothetical protein